MAAAELPKGNPVGLATRSRGACRHRHYLVFGGVLVAAGTAESLVTLDAAFSQDTCDTVLPDAAGRLRDPVRRGQVGMAAELTQRLKEAECICRQSGARLTPLRRQVLILVLEAETPVTAYELLDRLRADRSATPAGIYRSLDFLVARGLVHRLASRKAFVACVSPDHRHVSQFLICRQCGTTVEVEDERITLVVHDWSQKLGFRVEAESLEVSGFCAACQSASIQSHYGDFRRLPD